MFFRKRKSEWKVVNSVNSAIGISFAAASKGTLTLEDPDGINVDFPIQTYGVGQSWGIKYAADDKISSASASLVVPLTFLPTVGEIWVTNGAAGDELTIDDFAGCCLALEVSLGAVAMTGSLTALLVGVPLSRVPREFALMGANLSPTLRAIPHASLFFSSIKAEIWIASLTMGYGMHVGGTASVGKIDESKYTEIPLRLESSYENPEIEFTQTSKDKVVISIPADILFAWDESRLKSDAETTNALMDARRRIDRYPKRKILIIGHTDSTEKTPGYNQKLSLNRAQSVWGWLVGAGVASTRMTCEGRAATQKVASNNTEQGRQQNRRVNIVLTE